MYVIIALVYGSKSGWKDVSKVEGVRAFPPPPQLLGDQLVNQLLLVGSLVGIPQPLSLYQV